jgi:purine-nucleoside phosphorylase
LSPIHLRAHPGDVAERVLIPGDPRRARYIAETFLDEHRVLVIATAAAPSDGTMLTYTEGLPYAPAASFDVVHAAFHAAERQGRRPFVGPIVSSDVFYHPERTLWQRWNRFGVLGVEMESSAVFTLAAMHGIRAGTLLTVSDTLHTVEFERISDAELRDAVDAMVRLGLETLRALD